MERYLLFHGKDFFPSGGMLDLKKSSDNIEELKDFIKEMKHFEWAHIYDTHEKKIILMTREYSRNFIKDLPEYSWVIKDNF